MTRQDSDLTFFTNDDSQSLLQRFPSRNNHAKVYIGRGLFTILPEDDDA